MRTSARVAMRASACLMTVVLMHVVTPLVAGQQPDASGPRLGISLSPAVVTLKGQPGQAHRQTLRLMNHTARELAFTLEAQDVMTEAGRRVFVAAGELSDSIAATAVFSPKEIVIAPGAVGSVDVTFTVPPRTTVRGIAAIFRGRTELGTRSGVAMTASLGCLMTLTLSSDVRLESSRLEVSEQSNTTNLTVAEWVTNTGSEPVVAHGALALLNDAGVLVGKVPVDQQRLMPGERLTFGAEYPTVLRPGRYRAILSLEYEQHLLTSTVDFTVPAVPGDRRAADHGARVRP